VLRELSGSKSNPVSPEWVDTKERSTARVGFTRSAYYIRVAVEAERGGKVDRSNQNQCTMHDAMLILHFLGLVMGLGTGFAFIFLGVGNADLKGEDARTFRQRTSILTRMGAIGLALLVVSGLFLMGPYWNVLPDLPLLIAKLVLVVVMIVLITLLTFAVGKGERWAARSEVLGKIMLLTSLSTLVLAVLVFH
jgi:hypothetical protein